MGNAVGVEQDVTALISNVDNDYNPFNIPNLDLESPEQFNGAIAFQGCPPPYSGTKAKFASYSVEQKAAYADGVVRGSYQREWMIKQLMNTNINSLKSVNDSSIGTLAYVYLKTDNKCILNVLGEWTNANLDNHGSF